ncbi:NUDIX domain-containing protein [Streptomyces violens]|uniref:NUDIX domain-containing protein n=1 Tax=Streptomyces violens TaxID=66377 RepID=UPI0004BEAE0A|nr:NUDIX domain-containing protein [Streptomyces violens]
MPPSRSLIRDTVEAYLVRHPNERTALTPLLKALAHPADPTSRTAFPGHVTCSALVIDEAGRVLHIHHRASGKALAPGGHTEPGDETLAAAALRELHEEAGIPPHAVAAWPGYDGAPLDIDVHDIDASPAKKEPAHQHYDLRFVFRLLGEGAITLQTEEVSGWEWRPVDRVTAPTLREKLLKLGSPTPVAEPPNTSECLVGGTESAGSGRPPAVQAKAPSGTVLNVIGVHLYLEDAEGRVLLGLRHPDSAYAGSMHHFLAGHCEQESAVSCLVREAREEAGLLIDPIDVDLAHVVHLVDTPGDRPRMQMVFRARAWSGTPEVLEPDRCISWGFWHPQRLPEQVVPYTRAAIEGIRAGCLYTELGWT